MYSTRDHTLQTLLLPNPTLTSINVLENIIFDHIGDPMPEAPQAVGPQPETPQATEPQTADP